MLCNALRAGVLVSSLQMKLFASSEKLSENIRSPSLTSEGHDTGYHGNVLRMERKKAVHDEDAFQHQMVSSLAALEVTRILGNLHVGLSRNEDNSKEDITGYHGNVLGMQRKQAEDSAPELDDGPEVPT